MSRQPLVLWTASRDGIRHGFYVRHRRTLCGLGVDERFTRTEMPKCAVCSEMAEVKV